MNLVKAAYDEIQSLTGVPDVQKYVSEPPTGHGDLALQTFQLAKVRKQQPQQIAQDIASKISLSSESIFSGVRPVGGYVNFFYNYPKVAGILLPLIDRTYGMSNSGNRLRVMVEHTSVNPNKALHIGHARNACLGDSISRLLRFAGYDVQVANYIDDTGSQVADTIVGFKFMGFPLEKSGVKFDHYAGDEVYVEVTKRYEQDESLKAKRTFVLKRMEEGNNEIATFADEFVNSILQNQLQTLGRMGISYNLLNHESHILKYKFWDNAFERLKESGCLRYEESGKNAGCWVLNISTLPDWFKNKYGNTENPNKILVRSDSTTVYAAKDIAYAMWKHGLLGEDFRYEHFGTQRNGETMWTTTIGDGIANHPNFGNVEKSINVIDQRQSHEQDVVKLGLELMGGGQKEYVHYAYDVVSLSKDTLQQLDIEAGAKSTHHMSGRRGIVINTDNVLNTLANKTYNESKKRNADADENWLRKTADSIAVGALRYELIKIDPGAAIVFDMNRSLQLKGDTGPYLQYTLARAYNLLEKVGSWQHEPATITNEYEQALLKSIMSFPSVIETAAIQLKPSFVARYANGLATSFNNFYEKCPILRADSQNKMNFRSSLANATMYTLSNSLDVIGVPVLEKM
ncbi:arginine--tRNA ligase [archaeon]|nr:MAG: arginine--tRNA ligase [archaeon]